MSVRKEHITVCVCTYKRPKQLKKLLDHVFAQKTDDLFSISVSLVDNDPERSAKTIVDCFPPNIRDEIFYTHCADSNLARLRNVSVEHSRGDYVAFIDDDEYPAGDWLLFLHETIRAFHADGALGPVVPEYLDTPPAWVVRGKLCERVRLKTGTRLQWTQTRTGNALLKRSLVLEPGNLFDLKYRLGAEDDSFFQKLMSQGYAFVWCDEAVVHEQIPADRLTLAYFSRRSRLIGHMTYRYYKDARSPFDDFMFSFKSVLAAGVYLGLMPLIRVLGYHHYAKIVIRYHFHKAVIMTRSGKLKIERRDI